MQSDSLIDSNLNSITDGMDSLTIDRRTSGNFMNDMMILDSMMSPSSQHKARPKPASDHAQPLTKETFLSPSKTLVTSEARRNTDRQDETNGLRSDNYSRMISVSNMNGEAPDYDGTQNSTSLTFTKYGRAVISSQWRREAFRLRTNELSRIKDRRDKRNDDFQQKLDKTRLEVRQYIAHQRDVCLRTKASLKLVKGQRMVSVVP